jgi:cytochrome c oxidase cbb3-type subunit 1
MVMYGVFSQWLIGVTIYLLPRIWKTDWYSRRMLEWQYWTSLVGIAVMSADLIILGVFQGLMWASLAPWSDTISFSIPWWALRVVSGLLLLASHSIFLTHMVLTWMKAVAERKAAGKASHAEVQPA